MFQETLKIPFFHPRNSFWKIQSRKQFHIQIRVWYKGSVSSSTCTRRYLCINRHICKHKEMGKSITRGPSFYLKRVKPSLQIKNLHRVTILHVKYLQAGGVKAKARAGIGVLAPVTRLSAWHTSESHSHLQNNSEHRWMSWDMEKLLKTCLEITNGRMHTYFL